MTDDELNRMPWTKCLMTDAAARQWLESREAAGAAIDIETCELGGWYASDNGCPYGIKPSDDGYIGSHRFVRSAESCGWVHEGDLPLEKLQAMYRRIEREAPINRRDTAGSARLWGRENLVIEPPMRNGSAIGRAGPWRSSSRTSATP